MSRRDIVTVGASAGGVPALRLLAAQLPPDFPAAVFMVLHVGAHTSSLPLILSAAGPNPARHAEHGQPLQRGVITIAPPDHHMTLNAEGVQVLRGPKEHHTRPAIDPLFRSAALSFGARVVGVVLTGLLDDGTAGLQAIKECGGLAVVQDPDTAEEPSMPASALRAVSVDHCVPLSDMGKLLLRLVQQSAGAASARSNRLAREHAVASGGENAMEELRAFATPSTFVCPDCKGALWEVDGSNPPRYRCHTGHAFSLRTLTDVQETKTDEAMWSAIRALQEKELLLHKVAALDHAAGDSERARRSEVEAERIGEQMLLLRRLVERP